jgi:O-antigen ligase
MAVTFGNVSMLLGFLSAIAALYYFSQRRYVCLTLALAGFLAGVMASLLSGTRGGWLVLPPLLLFLGWYSRELLGSKTIAGIALVSLVGGIVILNIPQLGVADRLWAVITGVQDYWQGKTDLSVGGRLEMWRANLQFFVSSPLLGVGEYRGLALKQALAQAGLMSEVAAAYPHAHNEYIDALGLRGLVGFAALLAIYVVPLRLFLTKLGSCHRNWRLRCYALAGALIPLSYMIFALTDSMFSNNIGVMLYAFPVAFFWAAVRREETLDDQTAPTTTG